MGFVMEMAPRRFFICSLMVFTTVAGICAWRLLPAKNAGMLRCSTKVIMHFENNTTKNINGKLHLDFGAGGKGSLMVEGYTDSAAGWLYLQRYVKFTYTTKKVSASERDYRINSWEASASSIDQSPDVIFDYFMREMSDSHDGLFLNARKLNNHAVLFSSVSSPLYICTLKPTSKFD